MFTHNYEEMQNPTETTDSYDVENSTQICELSMHVKLLWVGWSG